ncbi:MAG: hypothetical protein K5873_02330 [Treponema sp.]|nr:hypothetical protein [Treponema sp.]
MKKKDRILNIILLSSFFIFILSIIFKNGEKSAPKSIDSAILNPKNIESVNLIELSHSRQGKASSIFLKKQGDFWLFYGEEGKETVTFADSKMVKSLIENSSQIRKIYPISAKREDFFSLGIEEGQTFTLNFLESEGKILTKVNFGKTDSLKNRIYFSSCLESMAYECQDSFSQFLTLDSAYWAEGQIFPEIKNSTAITFTENNKVFSLDEKSQNFSSKNQSLLSLRHGKTFNSEKIKGMVKKTSLTIQDGNGRISRLDFYQSSANEEESSYYYIKSIKAGENESQENTFALYSENACYELSLWTYGKIQSLFN